MDQYRYASCPALLFVLAALLCPLSARAQVTSNVVIDDVENVDGNWQITVSNSDPTSHEVVIRMLIEDVTSPEEPVPVYKARSMMTVTIPGSCKKYKLPLVKQPLYPGFFRLTTEIRPRQGNGPPLAAYTVDVVVAHWQEVVVTKGHTGGEIGDPVSTLTGELFFTEEPDFFLPGPIPLTFQRSWSSRALPHLIGMPTLGRLWHHNYDAVAFRVDDTVRVGLPGERPVDFVLDGGAWRRVSPYRQDVRLVSLGDTLVYGDPSDPYLYYFGPRGLLAAIEDLAGNRLTLSYTGRFLDRVENGLGRTLHFTYDSIGRLTMVSDGTREVTFQAMAFTENLGESLRTMIDANGGRTTYFNQTVPDIDRQLLLSRYTPRGNRPWTQAYDSIGRVTTQTDAYGQAHRLIYLDNPALTLIINPDGDTVVHQHDGWVEPGNGIRKLVEVRDEEGERTRFGYRENRLTSIVNRLGDSAVFEYDERGRMTSYRDPEGYTSSYHYQEIDLHGIPRSLLAEEELPDGTERTWEHDAEGNPVAFVDRAGNRFAYEYNDRGMLLSETLPTGGVVRYEYDEAMNLTSMTDPAGNTTTFTYDGLGRLTGATLADGSTVAFEVDPFDRITAVTDAEGNRRETTYDANGNMIGTVDAAGGEEEFRYDLMERIDTAIDRRGGMTTYDFTPYGELQQLTAADGGITTWEYDRRGLVTAVIDNGGRRFLREHDAEGRVVRSVDPLGDAVAYEHDRRGFLTAVTSPEGSRLAIDRDAMGRATRIVAPSGRNTTIEYEGTGQPQRIATGEGVAGLYERNGLGEITAVIDPNGERWESEYDQGGRMTLRRDPLGRITSLSYDVRNRVDSVILPGDMGSKAITYNRNGQVVAERWSDGTAIDYERDGLGRVTASDGVRLGYDAEGSVTSSNGVTIERDVMGRPTAMTLASGKSVEYRYNADGTLQSVSDWNGNAITFDYDAEGKLTEIGRPNGVSTTWTYDRDNQWSAIRHGTIASMEFERDADGRIIAAERSLPLEPEILPSIRSYEYDAASQRTGVDHDAMGRIARDGEQTFTWDLASRLTSLQRPAGTTSMTWNADGFLTDISDGSLDRELVWNYGLGIPSISVERSAGRDHMYYLHTPGGRLLARIDAATGAIQYYHFSENGSTLFLTDASGSVVGSWAYLPYGASAGSAGGVENLFTWGGEYGAISLGGDLYSMRARWYDASVGRFLTRDPIRSILPTAINPYQYVDGDPVQRVDIDGREGEEYVRICSAYGTIEDDAKALGKWMEEAISQPKKETSIRRASTPATQPLTIPFRPLKKRVGCGAGRAPGGCASGRPRRIILVRRVIRSGQEEHVGRWSSKATEKTAMVLPEPSMLRIHPFIFFPEQPILTTWIPVEHPGQTAPAMPTPAETSSAEGTIPARVWTPTLSLTPLPAGESTGPEGTGLWSAGIDFSTIVGY